MSDEQTHYIGWVQQKDNSGVIYYAPEIFDDFKTACSEISEWDMDSVIKNLKKGIELTKTQKVPTEEDLVGLPRIGQNIWAVKDWGDRSEPKKRYESLEVTVTEFVVQDGEVLVAFGFYYKKKGEWFWTKAEAEGHRKKLMSCERVEYTI